VNVNKVQQRRIAEILEQALTNIRGSIAYFKIQLKEGPLTRTHPLVTPFFKMIDEETFLAYNGFIMDNKDVRKDIACKESWNYLKRNIVIWGDCIKLNYGEKPEDNPKLWARMEEYVTSMAKVFKGIRLDNAHGTPLHVSEYMLAQARKANPQVFVVAELFTGSTELDAYYVTRLGINALIREAMHAPDSRCLGGLVYIYGNGETMSIGRLQNRGVKLLQE
jgi:glycogen debranching enzyme